MRIGALAIRIVRQFIRDKRTLALMLLAPLLVLTLMKFVFDGQAVDPRIGAVGVPDQAVVAMEQASALVTRLLSEQAARDALEAGDLDGALVVADGRPHLLLEGSSPGRNRSVLEAVRQAMQSKQSTNPTLELKPEFIHGSADLNIFDYYGSVLVGFFSFFFVFLIAGVSFLRERTTGTLQRLLATPLRRWEVVAGYLLGFGLFTIVQATLIAWYATSVLGIELEGSLCLVLLINLLLALTALSLGTLLSAFAQNEFQMFQFIPLIVVPQIFFCGLIELESMPEWLQALGKALPLFYGADAMRGIMLRGEAWTDVWPDALALVSFALGFALLNVLALRKHRPI